MIIERVNSRHAHYMHLLCLEAYGFSEGENYFKKKFSVGMGLGVIGYFAFDEILEEPAAFYLVYLEKNGIDIICQSGDTIVAKSYQGRGLFNKLAQKTYEECRNNNIKLVYGFPNKSSAPGFKKLGWNLSSFEINYFPFFCFLPNSLIKFFGYKCLDLNYESVSNIKIYNDFLASISSDRVFSKGAKLIYNESSCDFAIFSISGKKCKLGYVAANSHLRLFFLLMAIGSFSGGIIVLTWAAKKTFFCKSIFPVFKKNNGIKGYMLFSDYSYHKNDPSFIDIDNF